MFAMWCDIKYSVLNHRTKRAPKTQCCITFNRCKCRFNCILCQQSIHHLKIYTGQKGQCYWPLAIGPLSPTVDPVESPGKPTHQPSITLIIILQTTHLTEPSNQDVRTAPEINTLQQASNLGEDVEYVLGTVLYCTVLKAAMFKPCAPLMVKCSRVATGPTVMIMWNAGRCNVETIKEARHGLGVKLKKYLFSIDCLCLLPIALHF